MNTLSDAGRLVNDVQVIVEMLCPKVDVRKLAIRLEEIMVNYNITKKTHEEASLDLPDKIEMFISAKDFAGFSELTLNDYRRELNLFDRYTKKATAHINDIDIMKYLSSNSKLMKSTIGTKLSVFKSFFGWLVSKNMLLRDPTVSIETPKTPKRLPKGLSIEELEIIRESCKTLRERALVEVLYSTGCRLSEIANLKITDVNFQSLSASVIGKGDKERIVYFSVRAMFHLKKYLNNRKDECEYLIATVRRPIRRMSNASIEREVKIVWKRSGIKKNVTPHTFRHTLATILINNGANLAEVQGILGHEDPSTTLVYAHVSEVKKQQAFVKYHVM